MTRFEQQGCVDRVKIKNIEATEEAKQRLMAERLSRRDKVSEFVPTNVAVNFVQHNRCESVRA